MSYLVDIGEIIYKTLIAGDSYITLLKGLGVTLQISLLSVVLGTLLGMAVCAMRRSQFWMMRQIAAGYIAILRGSPVLLLLMLMYYVVFAGSHVSATIVAVAAFSLHMSAYTAACFHSAILASDAMQAEAARTLGFSKWQAFTLITLPQAAKIAKGTYQSTIVTLIQWTSVVGYVTITDLTRVINNIGSRTMQPLFMILVGLLLYLGMAYITNISVSDSGEDIQREKNYVVGVTGDLPPMDYVAADGVPAGFNVAFINAIGEVTDVSFTFVQVDADARLSALSSGKIDVIFWYGNVQGYTSERKDLLLTDEYYTDMVSYVTKSFDMDKILEAMKKQ